MEAMNEMLNRSRAHLSFTLHLLPVIAECVECVLCSSVLQFLSVPSAASLGCLLPTVTLQGFLCWPSCWLPAYAYVWQLPPVPVPLFVLCVPAGWLSFLSVPLLAIKPGRLPPVMTLNELYMHACCCCSRVSVFSLWVFAVIVSAKTCQVVQFFCCRFSLVNCRRKCSGSAELVNCRLA